MINEFLNMLYINEEFAFFYNNIEYEIVYEEKTGISLYLVDGSRTGKFISYFNSYEDFLNNGIIDGKKIKDILQDIKLYYEIDNERSINC